MGRIADGGRACETDGCEDPDPEDFACQDVVDQSGRPADPQFLDGLRDPFARTILQRPGACPTTYADVIAKLRLEDDERCEGDEAAGLIGRVVSERAQLLDKSDVSRVVVGRQCGRRLPHELLFETPPIDTANPALPETDIKVAGYDPVTGAFNFYALEGEGEGATWVFHGSSFDLIDPNRSATSACASCHSDGGLVMREIDEPWVHWESGGVRTVGAGALLDRFTELGARSNGAELSSVVQAGNARWNRVRMAVLGSEDRTDANAGSTRALLEPLFCGTTFNTQSAGLPDIVGRPTPVTSIPSSFFVDPAFGVATAVEIDGDAYLQTLQDIDSRVDGIVGPRDTFFGFTFVERAASDLEYVQSMIDLGVVDEEFVLDVLAVDPERPLFSTARCALLDFAPTFEQLEGTQPPTGGAVVDDCCVAHAQPGCSDAEVEACVCAADDACCSSSWDQVCVNRVFEGDPACGTCSAARSQRAEAADVAPSSASPSPGRLRNAFFAALEAGEPEEGTAAARLRDNLATDGQASAHRDRVARFVAACRDRATTRDPEGFVRDAAEISAWRRREAMNRSALLDTPGAVALDSLDPPVDLRWDVVTCELVGL